MVHGLETIKRMNNEASGDDRPITKEIRERILSEVTDTLDQQLGDTDPDIPDGLTDEDIRAFYPIFWCCRQLSLLQKKDAG